MKQSKKIFIPLAIIIVGLIVGGVVYLTLGPSAGNQETSQEEVGPTSSQIAEKALGYINQNLLQQGLTASLVNTEKAEDGVLKISFAVNEQELDAYVTENGKLLFTQFFDLDSTPPDTQKESENQDEKTIGGFSKSKDGVCIEDGKPIIYFFSSKSCSHCKWQAPIIEAVASKFKENIVFHNNKDANTDMEIFSQYSSGGIPALVMGCKYYRVGSGERAGQEEEIKTLTALICKLTNNQPTTICEPVQDLIDKI